MLNCLASVAGLSLYFSLPRHAFGEVQKVLFPKYFTLNSVLSFIVLVQFVRVQQLWDLFTYLQVTLLYTIKRSQLSFQQALRDKYIE